MLTKKVKEKERKTAEQKRSYSSGYQNKQYAYQNKREIRCVAEMVRGLYKSKKVSNIFAENVIAHIKNKNQRVLMGKSNFFLIL